MKHVGITLDRLVTGMPLYKAEKDENNKWVTQKCIVKDRIAGTPMMWVSGCCMEEIHGSSLGSTVFLHKWECDDYCAKQNGFSSLIVCYIREHGLLGDYTTVVSKLRSMFGTYNDADLIKQLSRVM